MLTACIMVNFIIAMGEKCFFVFFFYRNSGEIILLYYKIIHEGTMVHLSIN